MTWILTLLRWGLAFVLPAIGPLLVFVRKRATSLAGIPWGTLGAALLAIGIFAGSWWLIAWLRGPEQAMVAVAEVEAQRWKAKAEALEAASRQKEFALERRAAALAALESEVDTLNLQLEALRAQTVDPDAVCFPAGDRWLQSKQRR